MPQLGQGIIYTVYVMSGLGTVCVQTWEEAARASERGTARLHLFYVFSVNNVKI